MAKSATIFSLVGEICLDGRPVLPSLLVKLKYVNDLLAEREGALGQGRSRLYSLVAGREGHYLHTQERVLLYYCISVLYLSRLSLIPLTALDLVCMNKPIYFCVEAKT